MTSTPTDRWTDLDFAPDSRAARRRGPAGGAHLLLLLILLFMVAFVYWAYHADIDEVTRGDGRVVPSGQVQIIQHPDGGVVQEILVHEGDIVDRNALLIRVESTITESDFREKRGRFLSQIAAIARLEAELEDRPLQMPPEVTREAPTVARAELDLHQARQNENRTALEVLRNQSEQRRQELAELQSKERQLRRSVDLAAEELKITEPLLARGGVSRIEVLRLQREVNDLRGQLEATGLAIPRAQSAMAEAQRRIEERAATTRREALGELSRRRGEAASIGESVTAEGVRVTRSELRSPVRGAIKQIKINTVGGVIRPGQDLVEIVPLDETLLVEAKIAPADVAFLRPGQNAMVKITAYDFSIYGGLPAKLEEISADAIQDEKGNSFFRIRVRTDRNSLGSTDKPLPIIAGMTASVDVLTGQKTVLDYLLKPIFKARDRALRER
jgi:membrane fusion protein, adhesin transport system